MKEIKLIIDGVDITLRSDDVSKLKEISNIIMDVMVPSNFSLMNELNNTIPADIVDNSPLPPDFVPASDKQKKLLMRIPECAGRDINRISKKECSEIIERWNKSRNYSYVDQFGVTHY